MRYAAVSCLLVIGIAGTLAGCNASNTASGRTLRSATSTALSADDALTFGPYVVIGADRSVRGGEPSLSVGASGTLWSTNTGPGQIWKSSDRGSTWTFVAPPLSIGGGDMYAAEDDVGRVHVVDLIDGSKNVGACIFYYRSSDAGKTFDIVRARQSGGPWVDGDGGCATVHKDGGVDRPWVATFGDSTIYVAYSVPNGGGVDTSVDGGRTFTHAISVSLTGPSATTLSLLGRVVDAATGAGVSGVNLAIENGANAGKSVVSDFGGNYILSGLEASTFHLEATAPNYGADSVNVHLTDYQTLLIQLKKCTVELSTDRLESPASGGSLPVTVAAEDGCVWSATTTSSWIHISPPGSSRGTATIELMIDPSPGAPRSGVVMIGGRDVTVVQSTR